MKAKYSTYQQSGDLFSQLVRKIVIHEHRGALRELAEALGLSYGAMYSRVNSRAEFNPREINMLLRELPDHRLVDCLLDGSPFVAIRKPESAVPQSGDDVVNIAFACAMETLTAVQATVEAIRESVLDRKRGIEIEEIVCRAREKLSLLQVALSEAGRTTQLAETVGRLDEAADQSVKDRTYARQERPGSNAYEQIGSRPLTEQASGRLLTGIFGPVR